MGESPNVLCGMKNGRICALKTAGSRRSGSVLKPRSAESGAALPWLVGLRKEGRASKCGIRDEKQMICCSFVEEKRAEGGLANSWSMARQNHQDRLSEESRAVLLWFIR